MSDEEFITTRMIDDEILVMSLHGRLDHHTVVEFNAAIEKEFDKGIHKFIVDCAHLGYVSSYGIGALVRVQAKLRGKGGEVKLATVQSVVANVFRIVRLDRILEMYGDIEFARESFCEDDE